MPSSACPSTSILPLSLHDRSSDLLPRSQHLHWGISWGNPDRIRETGHRSKPNTRKPDERCFHGQTSGQSPNERAHCSGSSLLCRTRSEEHTSELQSHHDLVCRLLLARPPPSSLFPYTTALPISFLDRSIFIGAFLGETLIGFVKLVTDLNRTHANLMNVVSMVKHRDKAPTNALIAAAVRSCAERDRKSTRLNSSHITISYAVFCLPVHLHPPSFPTRPLFRSPSSIAASSLGHFLGKP